jgi:hypothetical protein
MESSRQSTQNTCDRSYKTVLIFLACTVRLSIPTFSPSNRLYQGAVPSSTCSAISELCVMLDHLRTIPLPPSLFRTSCNHPPFPHCFPRTNCKLLYWMPFNHIAIVAWAFVQSLALSHLVRPRQPLYPPAIIRSANCTCQVTADDSINEGESYVPYLS